MGPWLSQTHDGPSLMGPGWRTNAQWGPGLAKLVIGPWHSYMRDGRLNKVQPICRSRPVQGGMSATPQGFAGGASCWLTARPIRAMCGFAEPYRLQPQERLLCQQRCCCCCCCCCCCYAHLLGWRAAAYHEPSRQAAPAQTRPSACRQAGRPGSSHQMWHATVRPVGPGKGRHNSQHVRQDGWREARVESGVMVRCTVRSEGEHAHGLQAWPGTHGPS